MVRGSTASGDGASKGTEASRTQSVTRAWRLLLYLEDRPDAGVTELAQHLGVSPSTAHRLARTLCDVGLVGQDVRTDRYHLGPALIPLGRAAEARLGFSVARPALAELAAATGESVSLGVRQGDEVLTVVAVASSQALRFDLAEGSRVPIHASAMGKALLAFAPAHERGVQALDALTDATITDPRALAADLEVVRERGWALNDEERDRGVRAIGVPLVGAGGVAVAALAVQGPKVRLTDDRLDAVAAEAATIAALVVSAIGDGR